MQEFQRRQQVRKFLYSMPFLLFLSLITFVLVKGAILIWGKEWESARRVAELENKALVLALREEELKKEIESLKTEKGIFEEIKRKFNVTREGEYVAIIVDEKPKATSTGTGTVEWLKKWWNKVKGL